MNDYPNARDCEHGNQRGHCTECELSEILKKMPLYEAALKAAMARMEYNNLKCEAYYQSVKDCCDKAESEFAKLMEKKS